MRLKLCPKPIQRPSQFSPPKPTRFFPKTEPLCPKNGACFSQKRNKFFPKKRSMFFPKTEAVFPKNGASQSRWLVSPKSVTDFPKIGGWFSLETEPIYCPEAEPVFLLEQSQSSPKTYFLLLLQFRIGTHRRAPYPNETIEFGKNSKIGLRLCSHAWTHVLSRFIFKDVISNSFSFQAFGCNLLSRWISFSDCMGFMISFPNPVDFVTKQVGFVFHAFCISVCAVLSLQATASVRISPLTTANFGHYNIHCFSGTLEFVSR